MDEIEQRIAQREAVKDFWAQIHRRYPLTRGHAELGQALLAKHADKIGPMAIEEGIDFLGSVIEAEVNRRAKRDVSQTEARAYGTVGSEGPVHGHTVNPKTGETVMPADDYTGEDTESLGDLIRKRKERRAQGHRRWLNGPRSDRRDPERRPA